MKKGFKKLLTLGLVVNVLGANCFATEGKAVADFSKPDTFAKRGQNGARTKFIANAAGAQVLSINCKKAKKYSGALISPVSGLWDFTGTSHFAATLTNTGTEKIRVVMRVDEEGDWKKKATNTEKISLNPGETKTLKVWYGFSWGNEGYPVNPSRIARVLLFINNGGEGKSFSVDKLIAAGTTGDYPEF